jgi:outer membrane protein TolC
LKRVIYFVVAVLAFALSAAEPPMDLSLRTSVERTFKSAPDIQAARSLVEETQAGVALQSSAWFPRIQLELKAGTYHDRLPNPGDIMIPLTGRDRNQYVGQLVATQPIFSGFNWSSKRSLAKSHQAVQEAELRLVQARTMRKVIEGYFTIQILQRQVQAEKEVSKLREKQWVQVKLRKAQGRATELETLQAEYAVQAQLPQLRRLEADLELKELEFGQLIGLAADTEFRLVDSVDQAATILEEAHLPSLKDALATLLKTNPTLNQAQLKETEALHQAGVDFAKHLPSLDLRVSAGTNTNLRSNLISSESLAYGGDLVLVVPLFSGLESLHERKQSQARMSAAQSQLVASRDRVVQEMIRAHRSWELEKEHVGVEKKNIEITRLLIVRSEALYSAGRTTLTEVLEAYNNHLAARRAYEQATLTWLLSIIEVKALLGVLPEETHV